MALPEDQPPMVVWNKRPTQRVKVTGYLVTPDPIGLTPDVLGIRLGDLEHLAIALVDEQETD